MAPDPAEQVALFRYRVIAEALSERLSPAERGQLVRELASRTHELPDGSRKEFSRATLDRWIRAYRQGELAALRLQPRSDAGLVRKQPELLEEACRLRREAPLRSAEQISRILLARHQLRVSPRTISEHLRRQGLDRAHLAAQPRVFGRFEAEAPNQVWIGDVLHGPYIPHPRVAGSRRAYLFLLLDDHSRLVLHGQFVTQENTRAGQQVLRSAILAHGLPEICYFDNGASYSNAALERTCAVLGIRLVHSRPGQPAGRGKVERAFRAIREWFLSEATLRAISSFQELNDKFTAWLDLEFNTRVHAETGQRPRDRFDTLTNPRRPDLELLYEAFRWSATRRVGKTPVVSLEGLKYEVDGALCGQRVELHYDPDDLSRVDVWFQGRCFGRAVPHVVGRHVPARSPLLPAAPPESTGVDYLGLVERQHRQDSIGRLSYRDLNKEEPSS
ncbi:MAG TPA: DDE-type integrase/transposase/recombinase [Streptosporangiaceae bacterium]|nr:DDE-type integrase/transposase/recombinase [Streptosporangiaceae bacterium]